MEEPFEARWNALTQAWEIVEVEINSAVLSLEVTCTHKAAEALAMAMNIGHMELSVRALHRMESS